MIQPIKIISLLIQIINKTKNEEKKSIQRETNNRKRIIEK